MSGHPVSEDNTDGCLGWAPVSEGSGRELLCSRINSFILIKLDVGCLAVDLLIYSDDCLCRWVGLESGGLGRGARWCPNSAPGFGRPEGTPVRPFLRRGARKAGTWLNPF
jgi:hypothetical protein